MERATYILVILMSTLLTTSAYAQAGNKATKDKVDKGELRKLLKHNNRAGKNQKCAHQVKHKKKSNGVVAVKGHTPKNDTQEQLYARIERRAHLVPFQKTHVEECNLDVPIFKQFENNRVKLTPEGEQELKTFIEHIRHFLDNSKSGTKITLQIEGSASQIPTSFDPTKPNNNLNADGSSITGQTSIENNRKLALARALHMAEKIQKVYPFINVLSPTLTDIKLGETKWTKTHQLNLNKAVIANDQGAIQKVFEPFQKEQFVRVSSNATFIKTTNPKNLMMYAVSTYPKLVHEASDSEERIHGPLIVSKRTYKLIGGNLDFATAEQRDHFFKQKGIKLKKTTIGDDSVWFLIATPEEHQALELEDEYQKVAAMYALGIIHHNSYETLESIVMQECINNDLYHFQLKDE